MKKIIAIAFALLVFCSAATALEISKTEISLEIDDKGSASVTENYQLSFLTDFELEDLEKVFERNSSSLIAWQAFDERIIAHFGNEGELQNVKFSFNNETRVLKLEYGVEIPLVEKLIEDSRSVIWRFKPVAFAKFERGALTVIPEEIRIEIELPFNSRVKEELLPEQVEITENKLVLEGLSSSNLLIEYNVTKPIAPPINTFELLQNLFESELFLAVIAVIVIVAALVVWKRKKIAGKIEAYIVEHSEITKHEEEEFEFEEE